MENLTKAEELTNKIFEIDSKIKELKEKKNFLKNELIPLLSVSKKEGQFSKVICNKKMIIRSRIKRTLDKNSLLRDYNNFDSNLRSCFPLQPTLNRKKYNEMMVINPVLMSQYVTESNPSYSLTFKKSEKKESE